MAQAYTSPDWSSGEGISPSNLQSISNVLENIVQGTDKAIHDFNIENSNVTVTYVDGTIETFAITGLKGISNVTKSTSGSTDTYTIIFSDGSSYSFNVTNGGTVIIPNPTLSGGEPSLEGLQIGSDKYKIGGGGGNADKVELTKAEYDALPDSKLTDGKMYFINDWSQSGSDESKIYDGTERVIGSWFGKPLYRKVIPITFPTITDYNTVATANIAHNIANIKNIISLSGFAGVGIALNQTILNPSGTSTFIRANANTENITIQSNQKAWSQYTGYAIIEYTKTTDQEVTQWITEH